MPPKPSRKSKKLSRIEENNELRLSLLQRSIAPPQPVPLDPLTDMSPPPFEIRDLPPRSFGSGRGGFATAPAADTATSSTAASTTASNASTGTSVARSIRCKDLDLNVSATSTFKKRRGPVIGAKTQQMVKVNGKIIVEYSDEHRGPANEAIHSLISHDIGNCVPMSPKERGGAQVFASESILAEKAKSQKEQLQAMNERICRLEGQYADIREIVRQLKETCEAAIGSNSGQR